jgi:hypothetical protein
MEANSNLIHCLVIARALASLRNVVHIVSKIMVISKKNINNENEHTIIHKEITFSVGMKDTLSMIHAHSLTSMPN